MSRVRVAAFSISLDGFCAGPGQDLENPLGVRGREVHRWFFETEAFRKMHGESGGSQRIDNGFAVRSFENIGAWILGRNMFGPIRGAWDGDAWKGWWGESPPYHMPVYVLTHYARLPLEMEGGTTFYFVTDGVESALRQAREAANETHGTTAGGVGLRNAIRHLAPFSTLISISGVSKSIELKSDTGREGRVSLDTGNTAVPSGHVRDIRQICPYLLGGPMD